MLITCSECQHPVSDKAVFCPSCGIPLTSAKNIIRRNPKRMRLPNGFGSITKIKNKKLRNPYYVRVPTGKDATGHTIYKPLKPVTYFATYNDAYAALVEYHKNPYDLDDNITFAELHDRWFEKYKSKNISKHSIDRMEICYEFCDEIKNMPVREIRGKHLRKVIEQGQRISKHNTNRGKVVSTNAQNQRMLKIFFNLIYDYAVEYEIVTTNYARQISIDAPDREINHHMAFSNEEMDALWANSEDKTVQLVLIQCYSGWRPSELCELKLKNINLDDWIAIGGMKTDNGRDRIVPIHPCIRPFLQSLYDKAIEIGSEYLICEQIKNGRIRKLSYQVYRRRFVAIIKQLGLNSEHSPHDCRKQFVTMAKKANMDEYAIKRIVGHAIADITESIYTERDTEWLHSEISKIVVDQFHT